LGGGRTRATGASPTIAEAMGYIPLPETMIRLAAAKVEAID
jgi:hypothetical protein